MAVERVNIQADTLRWAIKRSGMREDQAVASFPLLEDWLSGDKLPTFNQLNQFASKFHVPFGYLFLDERPDERIPFPMFRGEAGNRDHFDLNVFETVMNIQSRQEWLEEYLDENDIETCDFVGCIQEGATVIEAVDRLREILKLDLRWAFSLRDSGAAVSLLDQQLQDSGVFIAYSGIVGLNTRRPLKVSECRGFALVNEKAPYIFVNSSDSKSAQLFTLIHEAAHLMMGISAGHAGSEVLNNVGDEAFCDAIAAEFLVPSSVLRGIWDGSPKSASRRFKASELVCARRAKDIGIMSKDEYRQFWMEYSSRPISDKRKSNGGDFYLTSVKRVGRNFAVHVRNAVNNRQLSYTDAYRLTGLHGRTFDVFMANNI